MFLGSGLLFLAPLFAATAVAGGLVESYATAAPDPDVWTFGRAREMTTSAPGPHALQTSSRPRVHSLRMMPAPRGHGTVLSQSWYRPGDRYAQRREQRWIAPVARLSTEEARNVRLGTRADC